MPLPEVDHVIEVEEPDAIVLGEATMVISPDRGTTSIPTDLDTTFVPSPHVKVYVCGGFIDAMLKLPEVGFGPLQPSAPVPPEAVQDVTYKAVHVSIELAPVKMGLGEALTLICGRKMPTFTEALALPFGFVHVRVKRVAEERGLVSCTPDISFSPLHPSEALHNAAFGTDHDSTDFSPLLTEVGDAVNFIFGTSALAPIFVI